MNKMKIFLKAQGFIINSKRFINLELYSYAVCSNSTQQAAKSIHSPIKLLFQGQSFFKRDPSSFLSFHNRPVGIRQHVRGFRTKKEIGEKTVREQRAVKEKSPTQRSSTSLGRYFIYTGVMVPFTFCGAMIWQYENLQKLHKNLRRHIGGNTPKKTIGFREQLNMMWNRISDGQRMFLCLVAVNGVVFCCWRIFRLMPVMSKYFQCRLGNPASAMTLSAFSHFHFWHIFVNMYVLSSFAPVAFHIYGKEQFLAVYLSGATISSLLSLIWKSARGIATPSLGASGALCAILASCCYQMPELQLAIAFVNQIIPHSFSAKSALIGLIVFDTVGLFVGWSRLDHAAHLGGTLFGLVYMRYGRELTWEKLRKKFLKFYHSIRKKT